MPLWLKEADELIALLTLGVRRDGTGHHRPESYYYDDVDDRAYRRGTPVGVADEGDDDDEPEDDEETVSCCSGFVAIPDPEHSNNRR